MIKKIRFPLPHFLSFSCIIFLVISSADLQSEWNSRKIKTEVLQINDRINLLSEEIINLKEQFEQKKKYEELEKSVSLPKLHLRTQNNLSKEYYYDKEPDFTWIINNIKDKVKLVNFELLSEVFQLKGYSFGAQAKLMINKNNYLSISLAYKNINKSRKDLNLNLIPSVQIIYKDEPSAHTIREIAYLFNSVLQYDTFFYEMWIIASNDITNDTISIDIYVEAPEVALQGYSYNGTLTWTINNFRLKREMEVKQLVWNQVSPHFYIGLWDFRVRASLRLNGYGSYYGKGLSVEIDFLTGPYDAYLSKPFKHKTTIAIFHSTDPTKSIVKSIDRDLKDGEWYMIDMATHKEIENLLDGNTLYYHVKIIPA